MLVVRMKETAKHQTVIFIFWIPNRLNNGTQFLSSMQQTKNQM